MTITRGTQTEESLQEIARKVLSYRGMQYFGLVAREAKAKAKRGSESWKALRVMLKNRVLFERAALGIGQLEENRNTKGVHIPDDILSGTWGTNDERNEDDRVLEEQGLGSVAEAEEWCRIHDSQRLEAGLESSDAVQANIIRPGIPDKESTISSGEMECLAEKELKNK